MFRRYSVAGRRDVRLSLIGKKISFGGIGYDYATFYFRFYF